MANDYLWDRSGEPDPEVVRLERLLADADKLLAMDSSRVFATPRAARWMGALAAAAVIAGAVLLVRTEFQGGWAVTVESGAPRVGPEEIRADGRLPVGAELTTDANSKARISVGTIGEVEVQPNTELRLVSAKATDHRLDLKRGAIRARIWAPPRLFFVDTPSATAVDLGCQYELQVDENGDGEIYVTVGWVALEGRGRESFIPAGAMCRTSKANGPGTPVYADAPAALRAAVEAMDRDAYAGDLRTALGEARERDAVTLWHLLVRTHDARVYERLAQLAPPPAGVDSKAALAGDREALDRWWESLGLGSAEWWRSWKQSAPGRVR
jgi:hypothetical protein